jgi:hypothetical protein
MTVYLGIGCAECRSGVRAVRMIIRTGGSSPRASLTSNGATVAGRDRVCEFGCSILFRDLRAFQGLNRIIKFLGTHSPMRILFLYLLKRLSQRLSSMLQSFREAKLGYVLPL